jgi:hypothetical protein
VQPLPCEVQVSLGRGVEGCGVGHAARTDFRASMASLIRRTVFVFGSIPA